MRLSRLIPVVLTLVALILSFLCLFAGSKKGFMESYAVVTLNTSTFGEDLLNDHKHSSSFFGSIVDGGENWLDGEINGEINDIAKKLGLRDWYSLHVMDYCEGYYLPGPVPNSTVPAGSIHKNVTSCSNNTANHHFNPSAVLQEQLDKSGTGVTLDDLHWPSGIDDGLHALDVAQSAVFVLYCIAIGLTFFAFVMAVIGLFFEGRLNAFANVLVDGIAFIAIAIASAIATVIAIKAAHIINKYGKDIDISANAGHKFIALTWVATVIVFVASVVWCFDCIVGRKRDRSEYAQEPKSGYH